MSSNGKLHLGITKEEIKFWIAVIILISGIAGSYARLTTQYDALRDHQQEQYEILCDRLQKAEAKLEAIDPTLTSIEVRLVQIQTDIGWMRKELERFP